ncbi:MAG: hypothetical protein KatS3mg057_1462 [Herpetosiphonaceae bacterium]|nr:MAG: hypothetical protein KatS3mg057_1462 [Herpetosiphonaceae bacterium]
MKRALIIIVLFAPAIGLGWLTINPQADRSIQVPILHFYVVTFITFSAAVISAMLVNALGLQTHARHVLAAAAFAVIGSIFFSHGITTPNALIQHNHPAVEWSAWLTLFGSALLFALASMDGPQGAPAWLSVRGIISSTVLGVAIYCAIIAFAPHWLDALDDLALPWHKTAIFLSSLLLWVVAAVRLWRIWVVTRSRVDGVLTFVAVWLAIATVSMHRYPVWKLSWWLYHLVLLAAFLIVVYILIAEYEQVRRFRLIHYYLGTSLILTTLLALSASALFTRFSYDRLVSQVESSARDITNNLAQSLASDFPDINDADDLRTLSNHPELHALVTLRVSSFPIENILVYDLSGEVIYASAPEWIGVKVENRSAFAQALEGMTPVVVRPPHDTSASYTAKSTVHIIETFAPIRPAGTANNQPVGVISLLQAAPRLQQTIISARGTGLATAAVTMGLLFLALLSVVRRADRIITTRTEELSKAYSDLSDLSARLKTYSEWLLGRHLLDRAIANPDALSLVRQERTILFMDIRNFTHWSEAHPPEEVVAMLNAYYDTIGSILTTHGAIKSKFSADEAMSVFASADQAVKAALALRDKIGTLLLQHGLGAGIGLHTGPLVEGLLGSTEVKFYDVIGDTVNTAKRIEGAAAEREVLLSEAVRQSLSSDVLLGPPRQITAKGKEEPVTVYALC